MPLSTSNSNDRLPMGLSAKMWMVTVLLAVSILGSIEIIWRSYGFQPTICDDWTLWCSQRDEIENATESSIVILGHSRMHQAFVPEEFAKLSDYKPIQLAIFNSEPLSSLVDLAENSKFAGVVVCSVTGYCLLPEAWMPTKSDPYRSKLIEFYHTDWGTADRIDRTCDNFLQKHLATLYPDLTLQKVVSDVLKGKMPNPQWVWTSENRSQRVDYDKADLDVYSNLQIKRLRVIIQRITSFPSYATWPQHSQLERLDEYVQKIQNRGGKVVFLRINTSGEFGAMIERNFPRHKFWDALVANTSAETIHYQDIPRLARFTCADGSHLATNDAIEFTRIFTEELRKRGIL